MSDLMHLNDGALTNRAVLVDGKTGKVTVRPESVNRENSPTQVTPQSLPTDSASDSKKQEKKLKVAITEHYIEGTLELIPSPYVTKGIIITVQNVGKMFSGQYYIKRVNHSITETDYSVIAEVLKVGEDVKPIEATARVASHTFDPPKSSDGQFTEITIQRGDTLWKFAKEYNTTINYLAEINNIKNPNLIIAGHKLKVPSKK